VSQRLFTLDEVNRLIPRLTELMETALERHRQALALQERLRVQAAIAGENAPRLKGTDAVEEE